MRQDRVPGSLELWRCSRGPSGCVGLLQFGFASLYRPYLKVKSPVLPAPFEWDIWRVYQPAWEGFALTSGQVKQLRPLSSFR